MSRLRASQSEFEALVDLMANIPYRGPGSTAAEILGRLTTPYGLPTLTGILSTQVSRGWLVVNGRGEDRRYLRTIFHVRTTLTELITIRSHDGRETGGILPDTARPVLIKK